MTETIDPLVTDAYAQKIHTPVRSPLEHTIEVLSALTVDMRYFLHQYQQVCLPTDSKISESCGPLESSVELWRACVQDCLYALQHLPYPAISNRVYNSHQQPAEHPEEATASLTERELEVLLHLARGLPVKETARVLSISEKTVRNHLGHLYHKLNINDRTQLVIYALKKGLIPLQNV